MIKLFRYFRKKEWIEAFISFFFIIVQVGLDLKIPSYMSEITELVRNSESAMSDIWRAGGIMLLCALGSFAAAVIVGFFAARIAASFSKILRSLLFEKVDSFSMEEINNFSTASLITRSTNDITQVQLLITMGLQFIIKAPIMAIWALTKIAGKGYEWSLATGITVLVLLAFIAIIMCFAMPKFKKMQVLTDNINRITMENLDGLYVVRAYNAEKYQENKFEQANEELTKTNLFANRTIAALLPFISLMMSGISLAIYWIGAVLIKNAGANESLTLFSNMVVFSTYAIQIIMAFMMLAMIFVLLPRASVSANRIREVLDTNPSIKYGTATEGLADIKGEVEFKNVGFKYSDAMEPVLKDINFTVKQGETIAFIGSTGSGKSTLINLIPRFCDATEGEILIDGINIKEYQEEALHNKIGYVPQKAVMFKGTVSSNVAFGDNGQQAADDAVETALGIAQARDFVEDMDEQYDAEIAQGGVNLSGGQKQRLAIARAIYRKPEIYIFDDSFSALDYRTDRALRSVLKKETAGVTSMIVAQRIGTIMDADQIIVLDQGRVVGTGTHKELLKTCDVYLQIAKSQLSEEELAS